MTPDVYDVWRQIKDVDISNDGNWVSYTSVNEEDDPILELFDHKSNRTYIFNRSNKAKFSADNKFLIFEIHAARDSIRAMKLRKVNKKKMPKDTLAILRLSDQEMSTFPRVTQFEVPKEWSGAVAFIQEPAKKEKGDTTEAIGTVLHIYDLAKQTSDTIFHIDKFELSKKNSAITYSTLEKDSANATGIFHLDWKSKRTTTLYQRKAKFEELTISETGDQVAFLVDEDSTKIFHRPYDLMHWKKGSATARKILGHDSPAIPKDLRLSEHGNISFSDNGERLYFGIAEHFVEPDTTLLDEDIVSVEVWTSKDDRTYPRQLNRLKRDKESTYLSMMDLSKNKFIQLESATITSVDRDRKGVADFFLGEDDSPGMRASSWEGFPIRKDVYAINANTGTAKKIVSNLAANFSISNTGKYITWFNRGEDAWYSYDCASQKTQLLAGPKLTAFSREIHDLPIDAYDYGTAGWTTDDNYLMVYDRYDIWLLDPKGKAAPLKLTNGRADKQIHRLIQLDRENRTYDESQPWLMHLQNEESRDEGYATFTFKKRTLKIHMQGAMAYTKNAIKAKNANRLIYNFQDFHIYPDIHSVQNFDFAKSTRISDINPQKSDYAWGTIEKFSWQDYEGKIVNGMVAKPDNFDPNKKYPLIVNFYERSSQGINRHRAPYPHRSTINYTYYTNRGYVIFNPDVSYLISAPGESAYRAVMSGVDALLEQGFVDSTRMGLQGHSWGGYQVSYLLTRTNRFKCAESGAPVVNMTSAYGGIRWGSGMSRMFQYEKTQSRLGMTLWENPMVYLENSPLFDLDKHDTPVLILHNDNDGAVPWYQGIEYFMGLRRLDKPAWFLNYQGEPHWPLKRQNREDFQLRMSQFFDHYLMDKKAPRWMKEGVPAINLGIDQALD